MNIIIKTLILAIFFTISGLLANEGQAQKNRALVIFLDLEGLNENMGNPNRWYLTSKLQAALQEKSVPLLINAGLWSGFIEKVKSIQVISQIADTGEKKALASLHRINERLNYWYSEFIKRGCDVFQSKSLMIDMINDEFYAKDVVNKKQSSDFVPRDVERAVSSYCVPFNKDEWEIYTNNKSMYLFVPKTYVANNGSENADRDGNSSLSSKELALGLKVDHLTKINDITDPALCFFDSKLHTDNSFSQFLGDFFVTKDDTRATKLPAWTIALSGHGGHRYHEILKDVVTTRTDTLIADLRVTDFQATLDFFEEKIITKCLWYATCYGSGVHAKMAFDDDKRKYSYAIINDCLSDCYSYTIFKFMNFPSARGNLLSFEDIAWKDNEGWCLVFGHRYQWKKFFKSVAQNSFASKSLAWLPQALSYISSSRLCATPMVRLPQARRFVPVLTDSMFKIDDDVLSFKGMNEIALNAKINAVLLESPSVLNPVRAQNIHKIPRFISLLPGPSRHYLRKLIFSSNKEMLSAFWPLEGDCFTHEFLIDEFIFPAKDFFNELPENERKAFGIEPLENKDGLVTFTNVLVLCESKLLRIFLKTSSGKAFMVVANTVEESESKVDLKGIHELQGDALNLYTQRYERLLNASILLKK